MVSVACVSRTEAVKLFAFICIRLPLQVATRDSKKTE
jgi:hypothetical protein